MKIKAIVGSPNKNGKLAKITEAILLGARKEGCDTEAIYLVDLNIKECLGCMVCQGKRECFIRDDIVIVEKAIKTSDIIIFASPVHWGNMSAIMLKTIERLFGFLIQERPFKFPLARNAKGKKAILVTTCSTAAPFDWIFNQSRACFDRFREICRYSGIRIIGKFVLPGTISMKEIPQKYLDRAKKFGKSIKNKYHA
jgi:multimeric flavodoxin WrbA